MAFEQHDIPFAGKELWNVADFVAGRSLNRLRRIDMTNLGPDSDGVIVWTPARSEEAWDDLTILAALQGIDSYLALDKNKTRRNITVGALVGGTALLHIYDVAVGKKKRLSRAGLSGISSTVRPICDQLERDLQSITEGGDSDEQALLRLTHVKGILNHGLYRPIPNRKKR